MSLTTHLVPPIDTRVPILGALVAGAAAGVAPAIGSSAVAIVGAVALAVALQALGWQKLLTLLIAATFVTRFRIDVLGASFRPEHLALLVCAAAMLVAGRGPALASAAGDRTCVLFGCFVAWSGLVSVLQAPKPSESLLIVGWLALDWLMLVVFIASGRSAGSLARSGVRWAGVAAAAGIGMWIGAQAADFAWGAHTDPLGDASAALGLSFEPNLFGATAALWGFVAITGIPRMSRGTAVLVAALSAAALAVSLTRSAMVALPLGLVAWASRAGDVARTRALRLLLVCASALLTMAVIAPQVSETVLENASNALTFESGTGRHRVEAWRTAVRDLDGLDWVVGLGSNSFGQRHLEPTLPTHPAPAYLPNLPLQILYDTGAVGASLLIAVVANSIRRRRLLDGRAVGLLIVYLVCALATSPFWYGTTWLLVAIAVIDRRAIRHEAERDDDAGGRPLGPPPPRLMSENPGRVSDFAPSHSRRSGALPSQRGCNDERGTA